jgi:sugar transferase (PEP-CTERM/EpsH1 system associated)
MPALSPEPRAPRTVVHVVENLDVGGLERVVINLMTSTDPSRYRCVLYALGAGGALAGSLAASGYRVRAFAKRPGVDWFLLPRLARELRRDGADVVHGHNYSPLVYGSLAARLARCAGVVYTAHGARTSSRRATRRFQRLQLVDRIVFVSEDARRVARGAAAVDDDAGVSVIVNGIDVASYARDPETRARVRASLAIPADSPVAGIVARLTPAKDHVNLFDAFARVRGAHPRACLVVVGDGELREPLRRAVEERGLAEAVIFAGRRDDVAAVLSAFDVFVLSSATEGLAVTLLEAMAAGLPVVATRVGGNTEVVVDGETGLLVPPRDPVALAGRIGALFAEPALAARYGEHGRARAHERFRVETMAARYQELYDALTGGAPRPAEGKCP